MIYLIPKFDCNYKENRFVFAMSNSAESRSSPDKKPEIKKKQAISPDKFKKVVIESGNKFIKSVDKLKGALNPDFDAKVSEQIAKTKGKYMGGFSSTYSQYTKEEKLKKAAMARKQGLNRD